MFVLASPLVFGGDLRQRRRAARAGRRAHGATAGDAGWPGRCATSSARCSGSTTRAARPAAAAGRRDRAGPGGRRRRLHRALDGACSPRSGNRGRAVVVLEARPAVAERRAGATAGSASASLTHGFGNGLARWPDELPTLRRLGRANLDAIGDSVATTASTAASSAPASSTVATRAHQVAELAGTAYRETAAGATWTCSTPPGRARLVDSPTYLGGSATRRTAWSSRPGWPGASPASLQRRGVRAPRVTRRCRGLERAGAGVPGAHAVRQRAAPGAWCWRTNAFPPAAAPAAADDRAGLRLRARDRAADAVAAASLGWAGRQGLGDTANQFHYSRLTRDDRVALGRATTRSTTTAARSTPPTSSAPLT